MVGGEPERSQSFEETPENPQPATGTEANSRSHPSIVQNERRMFEKYSTTIHPFYRVQKNQACRQTDEVFIQSGIEVVGAEVR